MHQSSMMISIEFAPADRRRPGSRPCTADRGTTARRRDQVLVEAQPFAHQPRDAVVRVGARLHALVAARALLEVQHQQALRLHQPLVQEVGDRRRSRSTATRWRFIVGALARDRLEPVADVREASTASGGSLRPRSGRRPRGRAPCTSPCGRRRRAGPSRRSNAPRPRYVRTRSPPGWRSRDLHEPEAHQVERVGRVALPDDHLARRVAHQLDAVAQVVDEVRRASTRTPARSGVRLERALRGTCDRARRGTSCSSAGCRARCAASRGRPPPSSRARSPTAGGSSCRSSRRTAPRRRARAIGLSYGRSTGASIGM